MGVILTALAVIGGHHAYNYLMSSGCWGSSWTSYLISGRRWRPTRTLWRLLEAVMDHLHNVWRLREAVGDDLPDISGRWSSPWAPSHFSGGQERPSWRVLLYLLLLLEAFSATEGRLHLDIWRPRKAVVGTRRLAASGRPSAMIIPTSGGQERPSWRVLLYLLLLLEAFSATEGRLGRPPDVWRPVATVSHDHPDIWRLLEAVVDHVHNVWRPVEAVVNSLPACWRPMEAVSDDLPDDWRPRETAGTPSL